MGSTMSYLPVSPCISLYLPRISTYIPLCLQVACLMEQYNGDATGGATLALLDDFQAIRLRLGLG